MTNGEAGAASSFVISPFAPAKRCYRSAMKETVDPSWRKARIAARIILKARKRPLNDRDKRLARRFANDPSVENGMIDQWIWFENPAVHALGLK